MIAVVVFELRKVIRRLLLQHDMRENSFTTCNFFRTGWFMTRIAVCRQRRELALLVMTHEALRVSKRARPAVRFFGLMTVGAINILVLVMCERDAKLRDRACGLHAKVRKWMARRVVWRPLHMAVRTDLRNRSLTREELLSVTIQTRGVLGKISDACVVFGSNLVTRIALESFFSHVSGVGKVGSARLRQRETDHDKC